MTKLRFPWTESDERFGSEGWLPCHIPQANAAIGQAFAQGLSLHCPDYRDIHGCLGAENPLFRAAVVLFC